MSVTVPAATETDKPPRCKRWIPLSLRMFVCFLLVQGAVATWIGLRAHRQNLAVLEIQRIGGHVVMREGVPAWVQRGFGKSLSDLLVDAWRVDLTGTVASDADLHQLDDLRGLEVLVLDGTQVTGSGLGGLRKLRELRELSLQETTLMNGDLAQLGSMPGLRVLNLDRTKVSNSGLAHLNNLTGLVELSLNGTRVNIEGLFGLKSLTSLRRVKVKNTIITAKDTAAVKRTIPGLVVDN